MMKMYEAVGVIEAQYFATAMELLDNMCKASNVEFLTSEKYLGGRLVTQIIGGSISDVTTAVQVAKQICESKPKNPLKMALIITNPHAEILKYILPPKMLALEKLELVENVTIENVSKVAKTEINPKQKRRKRTSKTTTKTTKEALS